MRAPALFAALVLAVSLGAAADDAADARTARAAFQKGQTEYNLGNYAEAAKQFEETYRIKPVPALLFNIAQCYRFIGNLEKAVQTYRAYLRNAPPSDRNIGLAKELLEQVESALASKQKAEQSAPHGLAPGSQPEAPPASPSGVAVTTAIARPPPPAPVAAPPAAVAAAPAAEAGPRVFTWVAGGASVVALAGGALFGLQSKKALSDLQTGFHTRADIDAQSATARSNAGKANAMLAAGAALAVVSGVLFALHF